MKKVAIVGVEGSGKTVLMAAMGDKYKSPDANGYFMMPQNQETFAFYTRESDKMRSGAWPAATAPDAFFRLDWSLNRKKSERSVPEHICEITFVDFAGETYRTAFGDETRGHPSPADEETVSLVKDHVLNSDVLIVLVNLADVINGSHSDVRTIEMLWLTQDMLRQANINGKRQNTALVFTQADAYSETITACGGLRGVLSKYLPQVYAGYSNRISLFAVAAVDKTAPVPDGSGFHVPAPDFSSEGLEDLVKWISGVVAKIKDKKTKQVEDDKKRGFLFWVRRCLSLLIYVGVFLFGYRFVWELLYRYWYLNFTDLGRVRNAAVETMIALDAEDFERFKQITTYPPIENMTDSIRKFPEEVRDIYVPSMLERRGYFWNHCKNMYYRNYAGSDDYRDNIKPLFKCRLLGTPSYVFKARDGLGDGRKAMLAVGQIDGEWKVIDFAWEE